MVPLLIILAVVLVGTSFALWQLTFRQTGTNVITTGCFKLTITEDTDAISMTDALPMTDADGKNLDPYTFTLENVCEKETAYVVNLETLSSEGKTLADNYVKANLVSGSDELFLDNLLEEHVNTEKVISEAVTAYKLHQGTLGNKEKISFSLRLWMDEETPADDAVMDATWQGKVTITASYIPVDKVVENDKELYVKIKKQAALDDTKSEFVTSDTGIDFAVAPSDTNGKGVYTMADTKDYEYPVHYFRGTVTNNNVKFANFCWKIVRTTETGGVKLIYNGSPNSEGGCTNTTGEATLMGTSAFNTSSNSADYVGYMYPESTNKNSSTIKTAIDTWYENNMTDYTSYLEDTIWCNDRSIYEGRTTELYTFYGADGRNVAPPVKPSVVCPNDNDKFTVNSANGNGKLTYPVALLTADEVTLAGNGNSGYSNTSYLYTNWWWWVLSPDSFGSNVACGYIVNNNGILGSNAINHSNGVRPAISLVPGTEVTDDSDGSPNNPYVVVQK